MSKINFTKEQLDDIKYLYTEKHLSLEKISNKYNCCRSTIKNRLVEMGISTKNERWKEYLGKQIGDWLILERDYNPTSKQHSTFFKCKCLKCGNIYSISLDSLKRTVSFCCRECYLKEVRTLNNKFFIGRRFGMLTVIGEPFRTKTSYNHPYVPCRCDCGKQINVREDHLLGRNKNGVKCYTTSCGCKNRSNGEFSIEEILKFLNIEYKIEYTFDNCINPGTNAKLRFDFYLPKYNLCIEYDGQQHYKEVSFFKYSLKDVQERDKIKNEYCKNNNINLMRIPYTDYEKLNEEYILNKFTELKLEL
jgi:hypothetical protein